MLFRNGFCGGIRTENEEKEEVCGFCTEIIVVVVVRESAERLREGEV